jgi:hypothetical protein
MSPGTSRRGQSQEGGVSRNVRYGRRPGRSHGIERAGSLPTSSFLLPEGSTKALLARCGGCHRHHTSEFAHPGRPVQRHLRCFGPRPSLPPLPSGALDHVGCHASRSIRPRICRKRLPVKELSASWSTKYRACRISRPPVLNSRCWRLVRDQPWMATGRSGAYLCLLTDPSSARSRDPGRRSEPRVLAQTGKRSLPGRFEKGLGVDSPPGGWTARSVAETARGHRGEAC